MPLKEIPYIPEQILFATGNKNKLKEVRTVATEYGMEIISPKELQEEKGLSPAPEVEEDGLTYIENALLKARALCQWSGEVTLGDDSGLEVTALGNIPGLYSARYLGPDKTYTERMQNLVDLLQKLEEESIEQNREAFYHCGLGLVYPSGETYTVQTKIPGKVLDEPRGDGGFGYDPIVHIDPIGKTFAEIDFSITCQMGFRPQALRKMLEFLGKKAH